MTLSIDHVEGHISRLQYEFPFTNITAKNTVKKNKRIFWNSTLIFCMLTPKAMLPTLLHDNCYECQMSGHYKGYDFKRITELLSYLIPFLQSQALWVVFFTSIQFWLSRKFLKSWLSLLTGARWHNGMPSDSYRDPWQVPGSNPVKGDYICNNLNKN